MYTDEDARLTYNDVKKECGEGIAEAVYCLTNLRGRNRKERANYEYYEGIRGNPIARFVKLLDRVANMEYGKTFGGSMLEMYRKELPYFLVDTGANINFPVIADYLRSV